MTPIGRRRAPTITVRAAAAPASVSSAACDRRRAQAALLEQPVAADERPASPSDARFGAEARAAPGSRSTGQRRHAARARVRDDRRADRMLRARLERRRQRQHVVGWHARRAAATSTTRSSPAGQRAGLVERDAAHVGQLLEARAALDQHALARRGRQRRHDRDRRRDHQRARARDHQQHQRAIDPDVPRRRRAASGGSDGDQQRRAPARPACRRARSARRTSGSARAAPARARRGG